MELRCLMPRIAVALISSNNRLDVTGDPVVDPCGWDEAEINVRLRKASRAAELERLVDHLRDEWRAGDNAVARHRVERR